MREILTLCIELDTHAIETYRELARECADPTLSRTFEMLGKEEESHVEWWSDLLKAWERGLIPDLLSDHEDVAAVLRSIAEDARKESLGSIAEMTCDEMLDRAAHLEFYMLDPVFAELLELAEPGGSSAHLAGYARHVERLVGAIEQNYSRSELARFLSRVLKRSWQDQQRLAALATHDSLTGLKNRRGFHGHLTQWVNWSQRYGHPVAVALVDVDDFKNINDRCGHSVGDEALYKVGRALVDAVRSADMVARYGGDEFAILLPETDSEELRHVMDRAVETVRRTVLDCGLPMHVSVSIGGAVGLPMGVTSLTADGLLASADHSLYQAKAEGKDRAGEVLVYVAE